MGTQFTPGPWKADMHGQNVLACDDQMMICNVRGWGYLTGVGGLNLPDDAAVAIQDANARLIAAAPELYEALEAAVLELKWLSDNYRTKEPVSLVTIDKADAALTKAHQSDA